MATSLRRGVTASPVVARSVWPDNQYHLAPFPHAHLVLRFLAAVDACGAEHDELGCGHVCWNHHLGVGLLRYLGEVFVRWARHGGEEGLVDQLV